MLEKIKLDLRISHDDMDDDVQDNIDAALAEMVRVGIALPLPEEEDALVVRAVKTYCRWHYNFEGEGERYRSMFESLTSVMSLHERYQDVH